MSQQRILTVIAAALVICLVVILIVLLVLRRGPTQPGQPNTTPNPVSTITGVVPGRTNTIKEEFGTAPLPSPAVRGSAPQNGQTDVPITTKTLTIQVPNVPIQGSEDVNIYIEPPTQFSYRVTDGVIRITFLKNLEPGTIYSYSVRVTGSAPYVASFTTTGPTQAALPGIEPPGFFEDRDANNQANFPDIHLANQTPFQNDTFTITSEFVENPTERFIFLVEANQKLSDAELKTAVETWIRSQGLAKEQIAQLEINYE